MIRKSLLVLTCLSAACTSDPGFTGVDGVAEITAQQAAACTHLSDIRAQPGVYGPLAQQGLEYSRNKVLAMAKDGGANAVVFQPVSPGAMVTDIRAATYRC